MFPNSFRGSVQYERGMRSGLYAGWVGEVQWPAHDVLGTGGIGGEVGGVGGQVRGWAI